MVYKNKKEVLKNSSLKARGNSWKIINIIDFKKDVLPNLVETIIFSDSKGLKKFCYHLAHSCGLACGVYPASIHPLYRACGRSEAGGFCVPAINLRTLTFDLAQLIFKAAQKINTNLIIFEIAKSEIGYTWQSAQEYAALITLAAIKQNYQGPIFLQGDHFQVEASQYQKKNKASHLNELKKLIREAVGAGFYNIDIDSSTLVDLSKSDLDSQQESNYKLCAYFTKYLRRIQPKEIEISIGGEIGEVGGINSKPEELEAFMQGYLKKIGSLEGISKISVQTGTKHGGIVLPDGSIADVDIDFDTLEKLSRLGREKYELAGTVQHGASTLPNQAFHHFPRKGCVEIHLATQFQNIIYENMPLPLKEKIYTWLNKNFYRERQKDWTNDQFIYKLRKKALGPFKKEIYSLSVETKEKIKKILEEEFFFLFSQLNLKNTKKITDKYIAKPKSFSK